jgi:hypothetical protein
MNKFNGVRVFSATMMAQRETLGETVTAWLADHPTYEVVDVTVTQSSDQQYHCIAITVWYNDPAAAARTFPKVVR